MLLLLLLVMMVLVLVEVVVECQLLLIVGQIRQRIEQVGERYLSLIGVQWLRLLLLLRMDLLVLQVMCLRQQMSLVSISSCTHFVVDKHVY